MEILYYPFSPLYLVDTLGANLVSASIGAGRDSVDAVSGVHCRYSLLRNIRKEQRLRSA